MIRVVIMSGKAYGKEVSSLKYDSDGQDLADEGNVVIYGETVEEIKKQLGLDIQMV